MNDYKITFTREGGIESWGFFTAATEAQARKRFDEVYPRTRGIKSVELIDENAQATKEQEREAIEQIRKIVATLGEDSYVATAMDGVLEIAEINIENDFADSLKGRCELAEARAKEAQATAERQARTIDQQAQEIEALKRRIPLAGDFNEAIAALEEEAWKCEDDVNDAARAIITHADRTESPEFQDAVRVHRAMSTALECTNAVIGRLRAAMREADTDA